MNKRKKITELILLYDKMIVRTKQIRNNSKQFLLKSDHSLIYGSSMNNAQPISRRKTKEIKTRLKLNQDRAEPMNREIFYNANLIKLKLGRLQSIKIKHLKRFQSQQILCEVGSSAHLRPLKQNFFTNQLAQVQSYPLEFNLSS